MQVSRIFNGVYTITSPKGGHRTFSIKTVKNGKLKGSRIVSMLTGSDNTRDYTSFGFVKENVILVWSKFGTDSDWSKFGKILWSMSTENEASEYYRLGYRILCEKKCIRCNRKLTHPESILSGIGPECGTRSAS